MHPRGCLPPVLTRLSCTRSEVAALTRPQHGTPALERGETESERPIQPANSNLVCMGVGIHNPGAPKRIVDKSD